MPNIHLYLIAYFILILLVSYLASRKQRKEDFMIAGRNRPGWQIMASKFAAGIGAGYFITYTGFAYEYGLGLFTMILGLVAGYLTFAYWASPLVYRDSKKKKFYTMGDFVYSRIKSKSAKQITNILSNIILFFWLLVGIIGGAKIINDFGLLSYTSAVIMMSLVVLAYILLAGYKAVIITDIIQAVLIIFLLIVITFGIIGAGGFTELLSVSNSGVDLGIAISFFLFGLLSVYSYSNYYQLCYAAKNEKNLKHGIGLAVIPILIAALMLLFIGLFMANNSPGIDSGLVFTEALKHFLSPKLLPWAIVLFFAGIMSSADTNIYAIASHHNQQKNMVPKQVRKSALWLMIITTIIAIIFTDIVDVSILAGGISLSLSLAMIYILFGGKKQKKFLASIILSIIGLLLGVVVLGIEPIAALPTLIGGALGLLWRK